MGQTSTGKIIIVIVLFLLTSVLVYGKAESVRSNKTLSLDQALKGGDGWKAGKHIPFDKSVVDALHLDDYLNKTFVRNGQRVSLYIGYYLTAGKVGAAHDPMVCFPGQGWTVSNRNKGEITLAADPEQKVSYSTMRVALGEGTNLILYWFQAYEIANADTLSQKLTSLSQKFTGAGEDNAFVRLTCDTSKTSESECLENMLEFTKAFYPVFLDYIRE